MDKLAEYIRWTGGEELKRVPLREADALVLCIIAYFDLSPVTEGAAGPVKVRDCLKMIDEGRAVLNITGGDLGNLEVFREAAMSKRFGEMEIREYVDVFEEEKDLQFSAVTFSTGKTHFIAYRGTDASLTGWKEDFMICFTRTEAQIRSLEYAEKIIDQSEGEVYLAGHSKGGNLALYSACLLDDARWKKVKKVYILDGPGLCPEVMDTELIKRVDKKAVSIVPEFDVVGKLFDPGITDTRIVKSSLAGPLEHSLPTWMVDHTELATVEKNDAGSQWISGVLNDWVSGIPNEERPVFVNELFDSFEQGGLRYLDDFTLESFRKSMKKLSEASGVTKEVIAALPRRAMFEDALSEAREFSIRGWIMKTPLGRAVLLLMLGAGVIFASGNILDVVTTLLLATITIAQVALTLKYLAKNRWDLTRNGVKDRITVSIVFIALAAATVYKESATFLIGSVLFGALLLIAGYTCADRAAHQHRSRFLKWLYWAEAVLSFIFGGSFLILPSSTVRAYSIALGVCLLIDGTARLAHVILMKRSGGKEAV